ncbi:hypothetical protein EWB00_003738 [Schistosoma japonicum]|uniref:Uncharacterized protein n=1 Tax=Schistosoma japonicum TaxID=6182 RepID=A0A4Z2D7H2_SCHJA|nr:hypothetical protein EWB00_003738 [Schistosoma japonicum]
MFDHLLLLLWVTMITVKSLPMNINETGFNNKSITYDKKAKNNEKWNSSMKYVKEWYIGEVINEGNSTIKDSQKNNGIYNETSKIRNRTEKTGRRKFYNRKENKTDNEEEKDEIQKPVNKSERKRKPKENKRSKNKTTRKLQEYNGEKQEEKQTKDTTTIEGKENKTEKTQVNQKRETIYKIKLHKKIDNKRKIKNSEGLTDRKIEKNESQKNEICEEKTIITVCHSNETEKNNKTENSNTTKEKESAHDNKHKKNDEASGNAKEQLGIENDAIEVAKEGRLKVNGSEPTVVDLNADSTDETVTEDGGKNNMLSAGEHAVVDNEGESESGEANQHGESPIEATSQPINTTRVNIDEFGVSMPRLTDGRVELVTVSDTVHSVNVHENGTTHTNGSVDGDDNKNDNGMESQSDRIKHDNSGEDSTDDVSGNVDEPLSVDNGVMEVAKEGRLKVNGSEPTVVDLNADSTDETVTEDGGKNNMLSAGEHAVVDNEGESESGEANQHGESPIEATSQPINTTRVNIDEFGVSMPRLTDGRVELVTVSDTVHSVNVHENGTTHTNGSVDGDDNKNDNGMESQSDRIKHDNSGEDSTDDVSGNVDEPLSVDNGVMEVAKEGRLKVNGSEPTVVDLNADSTDETVTEDGGKNNMLSAGEHAVVDNEGESESGEANQHGESPIEATSQPINTTRVNIDEFGVSMPRLTDGRVELVTVSDTVHSVNVHENGTTHTNGSVDGDDNKNDNGMESQSDRIKHDNSGEDSTDDVSGNVDEPLSVDNGVMEVAKEGRLKVNGSEPTVVDLNADSTDETVTEDGGKNNMLSAGEHAVVDNEGESESGEANQHGESPIEATSQPINTTRVNIDEFGVSMPRLTDGRVELVTVSDTVHSVNVHENGTTHTNGSVDGDDNKNDNGMESQSDRIKHDNSGEDSTDDVSGNVDEPLSVDNGVMEVAKEGRLKVNGSEPTVVDLNADSTDETVTEDGGKNNMLSAGEHAVVDNEGESESGEANQHGESPIEATSQPINTTRVNIDEFGVSMPRLTDGRVELVTVSDTVHSVNVHENGTTHTNGSVDGDDNKNDNGMESQSDRIKHDNSGEDSTDDVSGNVDEPLSVDNGVMEVAKEGRLKVNGSEPTVVDLNADSTDETVTEDGGKNNMLSAGEHAVVDNEGESESGEANQHGESPIEATSQPINTTRVNIDEFGVSMPRLTDGRVELVTVSDTVHSVNVHENGTTHTNGSVDGDDNKNDNGMESQSDRIKHDNSGEDSTDDVSGNVDEPLSVDNGVMEVAKEGRLKVNGSEPTVVDLNADSTDETVTEDGGKNNMLSAGEHAVVDNEGESESGEANQHGESPIEATSQPINTTRVNIDEFGVSMPRLTDGRVELVTVSDTVHSVNVHENGTTHTNGSVDGDDNKNDNGMESQSDRIKHDNSGEDSTDDVSGNVDEPLSVDNGVMEVAKEGRLKVNGSEPTVVDLNADSTDETVTEDGGKNNMLSAGEHAVVDNEGESESGEANQHGESPIEATSQPINTTRVNIDEFGVSMPRLTDGRVELVTVSDTVHSVNVHENGTTHTNGSVDGDDNKNDNGMESQSDRIKHDNSGEDSTDDVSGNVDEPLSVDNGVMEVAKEGRLKVNGSEPTVVDLNADSTDETVTEDGGKNNMLSAGEHAVVDNEGESESGEATNMGSHQSKRHLNRSIRQGEH